MNSMKQLMHRAISRHGSTSITFILRIWATGSDGTRVSSKEVEHLTISAGGEVEFEKTVVVCLIGRATSKAAEVGFAGGVAPRPRGEAHTSRPRSERLGDSLG